MPGDTPEKELKMSTKTWDEVGGACLVGAKRGDYEIAVYDDSPGPLWIFRNSIGIMGICRARTWGEAWGESGPDYVTAVGGVL